MLELLDALDDALARARSSAGDARPRRAFSTIVPRAGELGDRARRGCCRRRAGSMCSKVCASARTPAACRPALCANACLPTYGWAGSGERLSSSSTKCAVSVSRARRSGASSSHAHLQLQVGDDRDQVGVAGALADAVDRALHLRGAGFDGGQRVGDRAAGVVVGVDAQRDARQRFARRPRTPCGSAAAASRRWCRTARAARRPPRRRRAGSRSA